MRRFLIQALPPGFPRIRHYGLLANRHQEEKLALCRTLSSQPNRTLARHGSVSFASAGSDPPAAASLSEVPERHHDSAWLSAGLRLAGTSPAYIVMRLSFPSIDQGIAAPALHRRGVSADPAGHHFRSQTPGFSSEGECLRKSATGNDAFGQSQAARFVNPMFVTWFAPHRPRRD